MLGFAPCMVTTFLGTKRYSVPWDLMEKGACETSGA